MAPAEKTPAGRRDNAPTPAAAPRPKGGQASFAFAAQRDRPVTDSRDSRLAASASTGVGIETVRAAQAAPLWLCLCCPSIPLVAAGIRHKAAAGAVIEERQGIHRVLLANSPARHLGVMSGLSVNAALALAPELAVEERDPARERKLLEQLAARAEGCTSKVCIEPPHLLILEIGGSLRLFGGLEGLRERIRNDFHDIGGTIAIAPTPLAATWLARAGRETVVEEPGQIAGALSELPLQCLDWPEKVLEALQGMGIDRVGDCLRLPRQGFARRFGALCLLDLDRALGHLPDPRKSYRAPERFREHCELPQEQDDAEYLLLACRQLLLRLERFVTTRQVAVRSLRFSFFHLGGKATHLTLGCARTGGGTEQWADLLAIRLERLALPAPVILISLQSGRIEPGREVTEELCFDGSGKRRGNTSITRLMERLSARIGRERVHGLALVPEHRPQYVWKAVPADGNFAVPVAPASRYAPELFANRRYSKSLLLQRPLWLLPEPLALPIEDNRPVCRGALEILNGPERIETGWWDGKGIARDYFIVVNPCGMRLWIYRNRKRNGGWYLHGLFG